MAIYVLYFIAIFDWKPHQNWTFGSRYITILVLLKTIRQRKWNVIIYCILKSILASSNSFCLITSHIALPHSLFWLMLSSGGGNLSFYRWLNSDSLPVKVLQLEIEGANHILWTWVFRWKMKKKYMKFHNILKSEKHYYAVSFLSLFQCNIKSSKKDGPFVVIGS